jgi:glutathione S-transferase
MQFCTMLGAAHVSSVAAIWGGGEAGMPYVHMVIGLALVEFLGFAFAVTRARVRYKVVAPAVSGNEIFERYFRVQMNTLEQLVVFIPSIWIFAQYQNPYLAAALGGVFIIGRLVYLVTYVKDPRKRELGYILSVTPNSILLAGAILGAARAAVG